MLTLTIEEIRDLAEFAGLQLVHREITDDDRGTEIVVTDCPERGVEDEEQPGLTLHCRHIAYLEEYPEEGVCPLGPVTTKTTK